MSESDQDLQARLAQRTQAACNATLVARAELDPDNWVLRVRPDVQPRGSFVAGQFVMLGLPRPKPGVERVPILQRAYSLASAGGEHEDYEFQIARVRGGKLTEPLWELGVGQRLWIGPAFLGKFTLALAPAGLDLLFVATGSGVAPFLAMLRSHPPGAPRPWRRLALLCGSRRSAALFAREELEALQAADPDFAYLPIVSREPEGSPWSGARGRVQHLLETRAWSPRLPDLVLEPLCTHLFLCGNPAMIQELCTSLAPLGYLEDQPNAPGNLHFEKYW